MNNLRQVRSRFGRARAQRGIEVVEFVVSIVLILPLLYLIIELGMAMINLTTLTDAARAAARQAAVVVDGESDADYQARQQDAAKPYTDNLIQWSSATDNCDNAACCTFQSTIPNNTLPAQTVSVTCSLNFVMPVIGHTLTLPAAQSFPVMMQ